MSEIKRYNIDCVGCYDLDETEYGSVCKSEDVEALESQVTELTAENIKLKRMIDNGLGWEDMNPDGEIG